ncbi:hypothetical protein TNIN_183851 [Trichonephila inaurata madagascariensis]|uniref:Uncharacterized protein n=1 Tax=Trichonephila inaurata madagascariensis TaxID=2747483 RepID=A0A8X6MDD1_9ARAC|nr:hypothetical protein TNIN_183841 [Trichonephila inaurata madagascariensis]GFS42107.1 hypothetical protein TNIN_183851 [Trichonephila inaurata madagascariensis]
MRTLKKALTSFFADKLEDIQGNRFKTRDFFPSGTNWFTFIHRDPNHVIKPDLEMTFWHNDAFLQGLFAATNLSKAHLGNFGMKSSFAKVLHRPRRSVSNDFVTD